LGDRFSPSGWAALCGCAVSPGKEGERDDDGGEFVVVGHALDDSKRGHSGMLPCFFGGSESRLLRRIRSPRVTAMRVCDGAMTEST